MEGIKTNTVTNSHYKYIERITLNQNKEKPPSMARLFLEMPLSSLKNKREVDVLFLRGTVDKGRKN